jgi:fructokinase
VVLDRVLHANGGTAEFAGGTCGNVLTILAWLGWHAVPVASVGTDANGKRLLEDLRRWDVDVSLVDTGDRVITPVIVERITKGRDGEMRHSFSLRCPVCGAWFARPRVPDIATADRVVTAVPSASVFFFDRVSRGTVALARHYRQAGALVAFEPTRAEHGRLFDDAVAQAHVLKYSQQRIGDRLGAEVPLEIQTLGAEGLRFKLQRDNRAATWDELPALRADRVLDTAGSGDWCTAGFLAAAAANGADAFLSLGKPQVVNALRQGQALATINCEFEAARGAMYELSVARLRAARSRVMSGARVNARRKKLRVSSSSERRCHCDERG